MASIKANGVLIRRLREELKIGGKRVSQMALANFSADREALANFKGEEPPTWINEFSDKWLSAVETRTDDSFDEALLKSLAYILGTSFESITYAHYENPYRGLRAFGVEDANMFGGREGEARQVFDRLVAHNLVGIIGASGSGKSSLAYAGVCALIRKERPDWEILSMRVEAKPLESLFYAVDEWLFPNTEQKSNRPDRIEVFQENLRKGSSGLYHHLRGAQRDTSKTAVLVIDQWEELYTLCDDAAERDTFLRNLIEAVEEGACRVLLTVRADFYDRLLGTPPPFFDRLKPNLIDLPPMSFDQMRDAVEKPLNSTGLQFAEGLMAQLLDDVGVGQGQLPVLQFALAELWANRDLDRNLISHEIYTGLGGIKSLIENHANNIIEGLDPAGREVAKLALPTLVSVGDNGSYVKLPRPLSHFGQEQQIILRKLSEEDSRLLTMFRSSNSTEAERDIEYVELAHEELIRSWPTLRDWQNEDLEFHQQLSRLRASHQQYLHNDKSDDFLIPEGKLLEDAKALKDKHGNKILGELTSYIDDSVSKWEMEAAQRRARGRTRLLVVSGVSVVAIVGMFFALIGFANANKLSLELENERAALADQFELAQIANSKLERTVRRLSTANEIRFWFAGAEAVFERLNQACSNQNATSNPVWSRVQGFSLELNEEIRRFETAVGLESSQRCGPIQRVEKAADVWSANPERATNLDHPEIRRFLLAYDILDSNRRLLDEMIESQVIFEAELPSIHEFATQLGLLCTLSNKPYC